MLDDNARRIRLYVHGCQLTGADRFRQVVAETIEYVLRDLRQPAGGVSSAEDADREGEEGKFSVWPPDEVREVLDEAAADALLYWYGFGPGGHFEGGNTIHNRLHALREPRVPPDAEEASHQMGDHTQT